MTRFANKSDNLNDIWYSLMRCPNGCGRETIVTNICRNCPNTPADQPMSENYRTPCSYHLIQHFVTVDEMIIPSAHGDAKLEYSGLVENHLGERRLFAPANADELQSLECGHGVIFN